MSEAIGTGFGWHNGERMSRERFPTEEDAREDAAEAFGCGIDMLAEWDVYVGPWRKISALDGAKGLTASNALELISESCGATLDLAEDPELSLRPGAAEAFDALVREWVTTYVDDAESEFLDGKLARPNSTTGATL